MIVADALFLHFSRPAEQNTAFPMIRSNTYPIRLAPSGIGALAGGDMKVNVRGTEYTVTTKKYDEDEAVERLKIDILMDEFRKILGHIIPGSIGEVGHQ